MIYHLLINTDRQSRHAIGCMFNKYNLAPQEYQHPDSRFCYITASDELAPLTPRQQADLIVALGSTNHITFKTEEA